MAGAQIVIDIEAEGALAALRALGRLRTHQTAFLRAVGAGGVRTGNPRSR